MAYLFPNCLEEEDLRKYNQRERDLKQIRSQSVNIWLASYGLLNIAYIGMRRKQISVPIASFFVKHLILNIGGAFVFQKTCEKIAMEYHYNQILEEMAERYNFTESEVQELQRGVKV